VLHVTTHPADALDAVVMPATWNPRHPTVQGFTDLAAAARNCGARSVTVAAHPRSGETDAAALGAGFTVTREMLQLRRQLPVPPPHVTISVRTFDPDADRDRWLDVNHRAFQWHPEQGSWTADDLAERMDEPWFDPEGFLVHDGPDGLDAFCWTKVHPASDGEPAVGEIFVIAVDPAAHGQGLGRAMVLAGLDHLHRRGLDTAMLYAESDNVAARALYDSLGFTEHQRHRWYTTTSGTDKSDGTPGAR
jgi:mycothiol synthase